MTVIGLAKVVPSGESEKADPIFPGGMAAFAFVTVTLTFEAKAATGISTFKSPEGRVTVPPAVPTIAVALSSGVDDTPPSPPPPHAENIKTAPSTAARDAMLLSAGQFDFVMLPPSRFVLLPSRIRGTGAAAQTQGASCTSTNSFTVRLYLSSHSNRTVVSAAGAYQYLTLTRLLQLPSTFMKPLPSMR